MKPPIVDYQRPDTVADAVELLSSSQDAKLMAGGQSLMPLLNLRLARPSMLIDIDGLAELDRVFTDEDSTVVGAMVRHRRLEQDSVFRDCVPVLCAAAGHIGHTAIRNRGTLGGSLAHADPAAELPAVAVALDAILYLDSSRGRREVRADEFFQSLYTTAIRDDEMLTWVRFPVMDVGTGWGFSEFVRRTGDFALVGAVAVVHMNNMGRCTKSKVVVFGIGAVPISLDTADLAGARPEAAEIGALASKWCTSLTPWVDADYRRALAVTAVTEAVEAALERTGRTS